MTNLVNQLPESTFGDVLTTTNTGQGLPLSTPVPLQDGLGNNSPITMSQTIVNFNTTGGSQMQINGTAVTASAQDLNSTANYGDVLKVSNSGGGLPPVTPVPLKDSLGNSTTITMSQSIVNFNTTGSNEFQINGVPNFLVNNIVVSDTGINIILTLGLLPSKYIAIQFSLFAIRQDFSLAGYASMDNPAIILAGNNSGTIEIVGPVSGNLDESGLTNARYGWASSGNNIILSVQEDTSNVHPTVWYLNYSILGQS